MTVLANIHRATTDQVVLSVLHGIIPRSLTTTYSGRYDYPSTGQIPFLQRRKLVQNGQGSHQKYRSIPA